MAKTKDGYVGIIIELTETHVRVRLDDFAEGGCDCPEQDSPDCGGRNHGVLVAPVAIRRIDEVQLMLESSRLGLK